MVLAAAITLARTPQSLSTWIGIVAFLVASTIAERFPVPLDGVEANGVSLTFVFGVAAIDLFGWAAGVLIVFTAPLVMQIIEHRPPIRILSNAAAFALSGFAAGIAIEPLRGGGDWMLVLRIAVCAFVFYAVNMLLVSSFLALSHGESYLATVRKNVRWTIVPFTLMASGVAHARRALGARAGPLDRARGPAARDRALPALDVPRAAARCGSRSPTR